MVKVLDSTKIWLQRLHAVSLSYVRAVCMYCVYFGFKYDLRTMSRVVYKPYADRINNCYNIEHETTKVKSEINLLSS